MGADIGWLKIIEERGLLAEPAGACGGDHRTPPAVRTRAAAPPPPPVAWAVEFVVAIRPVAEVNVGGKLGARIARKSKAKTTTAAAIPPHLPPGPWKVTLTRLAGRQRMDDDNLRGAMKHIRDVIADALGCDDGDRSRVTWKYRDRPAFGACRVSVRIEGRG